MHKGDAPPPKPPDFPGLWTSIDSVGRTVFVREYILWVLNAVKYNYEQLNRADKGDKVLIGKVCADVMSSNTNISSQIGSIKDSSSNSTYKNLINTHIASRAQSISFAQLPGKLSELARAYQSDSQEEIKKLESVVTEAIKFYENLFSAAVGR